MEGILEKPNPSMRARCCHSCAKLMMKPWEIGVHLRSVLPTPSADQVHTGGRESRWRVGLGPEEEGTLGWMVGGVPPSPGTSFVLSPHDEFFWATSGLGVTSSCISRALSLSSLLSLSLYPTPVLPTPPQFFPRMLMEGNRSHLSNPVPPASWAWVPSRACPPARLL